VQFKFEVRDLFGIQEFRRVWRKVAFIDFLQEAIYLSPRCSFRGISVTCDYVFLGLIFFRLFVVGPRHYLSLMWQEGINHGGAKFRVRLVVEEV
jgi:hypothetical protein